MKEKHAKEIILGLLKQANIQVNGPHPWDIEIHNELFYQRVLQGGALGLGEAYVDGWWECSALDQFFDYVIRSDIEARIKTHLCLAIKLFLLKFINLQSKKRAFEVGKKHYDLGNDLFKGMLDQSMSYTCGYWKEANNLDEAQRNKLKLTCEKLLLKPGMSVLDIGCGWGAFAKYAAMNYGVHVVGITISKLQYDYAQENCTGLPIEIRFQDYRDLHQKCDRIVSLGMFEHVGRKNYPTYMEVINRCLKEEGLFLLHTIGVNSNDVPTNEWTTHYIFPHGELPCITHIGKASEPFFVMEDWHNFGAYYDQTLMAWHTNINQHWEKLKENYDERFHRIWNYYLLSSAGGFRSRSMQLWQIVFSKPGFIRFYQSLR